MKVFKSIFLTVMIVFASASVFAQDEAAAINTYNEALELVGSKSFDAAISKFQEAIKLADEVGNADIKERSTKQIPQLFYQKAVASFNTFRSQKSLDALEQAIADFQVSFDKGKEYSDSDIENRSVRVIAQLYYTKGTMLLKQEDYVGADAEFDKAIEINPNYAKAYYQKGLVHKNITDKGVEDFLGWFDKAVQVGTSQNDGEVVRLANNAAHAELLYRGAKMIQDGKNSGAIELIQKSLEYNDQSADSYYRLAEASNKLNKYDQAVTYAEQALNYEQGGSTDKAKIYFELGFAYQMKSNKAKACEAFTNASYGSFKAPSEHKMEFELKCESAR